MAITSGDIVAGGQAAEAWSVGLSDPATLTAQGMQEGARIQDAQVDTKGTYGWLTPGKQAIHAASDILENLIDLGGTFFAIMDDDFDEDDWQSTGKMIADNASKWIDGLGHKYVPLYYEPVSWDQAKESWGNGNIGDMFRFMRDSTPQAAVYMGAAMWLKGAPLFLSETQRVLDERMSRQGKTTGDAGIEDFVYSSAAAAFNVFLERMPILKAIKYSGKLPKFRYLSFELGTELMQGTAEEILATVDTPAGVDISEAMDQGLAEMIGGIGVIGATTYTVAGSANKRNIKLREAISTAKADASATVQSEMDDSVKAVSEKLKAGKLTNAEQKAFFKEIRSIKKEAEKKLRALKKAKSIASIKEIVPEVDIDLSTEKKSDEELEAEAAEKAPPVPETAEEATSEVAKIDAEIETIKEKVKVRQTTKARTKRGYTEQEAGEVAALEARKKEAQKIIDREAGTAAEAPVTPPLETTPTTPPVAVETPPIKTEARPGELQITFATDLQNQALEVSDLTADQQGTYFNLRDQGADHGQAMQGVLEGTTEWKAPVTPVVRKPAEADPAVLNRRVALLDRQRAAKNLADARRRQAEEADSEINRWERAKQLRTERLNLEAAKVEAEKLLDEEAQAETARQQAEAKKPIIPAPEGLDSTSLTNEAVTIGSAAVQRAKAHAWNLQRRSGRRAEADEKAAEAEAIRNDEAIARQAEALEARKEALRQRQENARKEAEKGATVEAATRKENLETAKDAKKEADTADIAEARNEAFDLLDSFEEQFDSTTRENPTSSEMNAEAKKIRDTLANADAKAEFRQTVKEGIKEIETEAKATAATVAREKAKPTEATREDTAPATEPRATETKPGPEEATTANVDMDPATRIDLARVYIEMEDTQAAGDMLRVVVKEGDPDQKAEARKMLKEIMQREEVASEAELVRRGLPPKVEPKAEPKAEPEVEEKVEEKVEPKVEEKKAPPVIKKNMTKEEHTYYNREEGGALSQERIDRIAQKRVDGKKLNKYEEEAALWEGQAERVAEAEGKIREDIQAAADREAATRDEGLEAEPEVEEDVGVEEEQTADEQTQEMIDKEQATVAREAEEQAEVAREEQAAEDTGPVVEPEVETKTEPEVDETAVVKEPEVLEEVEEEVLQKEEVVKWRKRTTADGSTSWRGSVGGVTARVVADPEDGMFNAIYDDAPVEGEKFATSREAQDFLVDRFGYPGQKRYVETARDRTAKPGLLKQETVKVEDQKKGNNPYAEEKENDDLAPVQVVNQPEEGTNKDWLVLVNGEPFKRYKSVVSAVKAADKIPYEKYEETLEIQAERLEDKKKEVVEEDETVISLELERRRRESDSSRASYQATLSTIGDFLLESDDFVRNVQADIDAAPFVDDPGITVDDDWDPDTGNYNDLMLMMEKGRIKFPDVPLPESFFEDERTGTLNIHPDVLERAGVDIDQVNLLRREVGLSPTEAEVLPFEQEGIDLEVSEEVLETIGKRAPREVEIDDDIDEDIDLGWGDDQAELDKAYEKERRELKKQKKVDKVDPTFLMNEDNPTDLSARLTETESRGGYSASQIKTLAANIKKIDPNFEYNPKGKRGDVIASIMEWYVSPSLESYEAQSEDNLGEYEGLTNDDVIESRRRDSTPEFLPTEKASASINRAFEGVFGRKAARRMRETGFVNIITASEAKEMGASKTAQAFISRANGSIYFIGDRMATNMDDSAMRGLIFHEMGVHLGRDIFSGTEWKQVLNELYLLSQKNDPTVNAAVARVMKAYDYKKIDSGKPSSDDVNFEGRSKFWEEVLAHVVEMKQPGDIIVNKSLSDKIRSAFKKFFQKMSNAFLPNAEQPSVDLDDLVNLVGYATTQAGVVGLARHGDSKTMERFRDRKRSEFIKDSEIKHPLYHGTYREWSHPLTSKTELGLHVGTSLAAIERLGGRSTRVQPGYDTDTVEEEAIIVDAFTPGWESKISNKNLANYYIRWREDASDEGYYTRFRHGDLANIRQGYINIKNPLYVTRDLGAWASPQAWFNYANSVESEAEMTKWESLMGNTSYDVPLGEEGIALDMTPKSDVMVEISQLGRKYASLMSKEGPVKSYNRAEIGRKLKGYEIEFNGKLRELLKSKGYDSIEYVNASEDIGSKSYILLDDNMFKSVDDFAYDGTSIFSTRKAINQTNASEIVESRKMEEAAAKETIYSRIGGARVDSVGKWFQRAVEPLMTLPGYDLLETKRMLAKGAVGDWHNKGSIIFDILNEATSKEKKAIFKYFTTRGADASKLPNRSVEYAEQKTIVRGRRPGDRTYTKTANIRDKVVEVKKSIEKMGQDLVDEGFISEEQYAEWKNQYLPRVYIEHVMTGADKAGFGLSMSPLTYTKTRKEHESFMKDLVSGRIDDPAFLASRYMSMAGADMAVKKYMDYIASDPGNHGWVLPKQIMTFKGMKGTSDYFLSMASEIDYRASVLEEAKGRFEKTKDFADPEKAKKMRVLATEMRIQAESTTAGLRGVDTSKYVKVPNSARFGSMRGLYVMKDIWTDINGLGLAGNPTWGKWLQWSGRAQKVFKYTKVPMNIPTQVRNIVSNTVLMNVSGTNLLRIPGAVSKAVHDVSTNGKYMQIARKYGLESTTFASEELVKIDRELSKIKSDGNSFEGMWARTKVFFDDYLDVGGRAYQKTEVLFKVAKIIDLMENHGKTEAEAAKLANEALLDYSNVSQGIRLLRTMPLGSPFITFNLKAAAQMVRNFKQHPFAVGKYVALPFLMAEMFLSQNDELDEDDWDSLMEFLPDYMETSMSTMVFPYKNDQNKWEAVDISFFLPWGAHLNLARDVYKGEFGDAVKGTGMFAGPWEIPGAIKLNEDPFTGQPIYNDFDPVGQRMQDLGMFLASYMVPPMMWPRNRAGDITSGGGPLIKTMMAADFIEGNIGRDGLPRYTMPNALLSWLGVSIQQLGKADVAKKAHFKQKELNKINRRFQQMISDPALSGNSKEAIARREELRNSYNEYWMKKYGEAIEWAEHLKSVDKLFA